VRWRRMIEQVPAGVAAALGPLQVIDCIRGSPSSSSVSALTTSGRPFFHLQGLFLLSGKRTMQVPNYVNLSFTRITLIEIPNFSHNWSIFDFDTSVYTEYIVL
jgi:hypothetical protein